MTLYLSIIFILSSAVIICNLPTSHGNSNQEYSVSTINQILTPSERFIYTLTNSLPSRIYYSPQNQCYMVREQENNDLRNENEKQYKTIPRWEYYLSKITPTSIVESGLEYSSVAKRLLGLNEGFLPSGKNTDTNNLDKDANGTDGDEADNTNDDKAGITDNDKTDSADDGKADGADDGKADGADDGKADGADGGKNNENEPGLLSKGMDFISPYWSYFNFNNNENNNKNNEKKDDKKEEEPAAEAVDYTEMAKDVIQSDISKDVAKFLISNFVPGGPAIVTAMEAASKYSATNDAVDNAIPNNLPI